MAPPQQGWHAAQCTARTSDSQQPLGIMPHQQRRAVPMPLHLLILLRAAASSGRIQLQHAPPQLLLHRAQAGFAERQRRLLQALRVERLLLKSRRALAAARELPSRLQQAGCGGAQGHRLAEPGVGEQQLHCIPMLQPRQRLRQRRRLQRFLLRQRLLRRGQARRLLGLPPLLPAPVRLAYGDAAGSRSSQRQCQSSISRPDAQLQPPRIQHGDADLATNRCHRLLDCAVCFCSSCGVQPQARLHASAAVAGAQ